ERTRRAVGAASAQAGGSRARNVTASAARVSLVSFIFSFWRPSAGLAGFAKSGARTSASRINAEDLSPTRALLRSEGGSVNPHDDLFFCENNNLNQGNSFPPLLASITLKASFQKSLAPDPSAIP